MIEDTMFDNDCYAVFVEEEHEKEKRVRDNISRQAAIDIASGYCHHANIADELRKLPSAEPKTGEWVEEDEYGDLWVCDQCGFASEHRDNYCPNCGAKMVREDGEE